MHTTKTPAGKGFDGAAHSAGRMRRWAAPADPAHYPPPHCFPYKAVLQQHVLTAAQHTTAETQGLIFSAAYSALLLFWPGTSRIGLGAVQIAAAGVATFPLVLRCCSGMCMYMADCGTTPRQKEPAARGT
ncbi:hypothetical protein MY10362_007967 [Beauveria mimosiformis]